VSRRTEQLGEEFRQEIARLIGGKLKDPRIGFVTVTRVEIGTDLRHAKVFVGVLGSAADREKTLTGLRQAAGFMRRELGQKLRMRHTPELTFVYDEGLEAHDRIARVLAEVHAADEAHAADAVHSAEAPPRDDDEE
jgi:ribosome-binding factor A